MINSFIFDILILRSKEQIKNVYIFKYLFGFILKNKRKSNAAEYNRSKIK